MEIDFDKFRIGMSRSKVTLLDHNPLWKECFTTVSHELTKALNAPIQFHHIGSTSIPTIKAKPILDVMGVVPNLAEFDSLKSKVEECDYVWKGEYGISGRRYCVKYNSDQTAGLVHLHVFEEGHTEVERHLVFRDYLLAFPDVASEYDGLKEELAEKHSHQRERYTESKADFIRSVLERAKIWRAGEIER